MVLPELGSTPPERYQAPCALTRKGAERLVPEKADAKLAQWRAAPRAETKILAERGRQDAKRGEQNHDAGTWALILLEEIGEWAAAELGLRFAGGPGALEGEKVVDEIVQIAAVAKAMVEHRERMKENPGLEDILRPEENVLLVAKFLTKDHRAILLKEIEALRRKSRGVSRMAFATLLDLLELLPEARR